MPYQSQSTAAQVSAFLQTDGKVESGQANPGETGEVLGARNRCLQTLPRAAFILTYPQTSCLSSTLRPWWLYHWGGCSTHLTSVKSVFFYFFLLLQLLKGKLTRRQGNSSISFCEEYEGSQLLKILLTFFT